jgi:hypothetical protein
MAPTKRIATTLISALILSSNLSAADATSAITCKAPKKVMATVGFDINCTSSMDIDGANAELQYENGSEGWTSASAGTDTWSGTGITFNRIYSKPKTEGTTFFRVVTDPIDGSSKKLTSNSFQITVVPFKKTTPKVSTTTPRVNSNPKSVRIPNFMGMPVQWIRMNPNAYPGVKYMITGSSCALSDVMSGAAVIVSQNPGPMQIRPYNALVILGTNC